jgi:NADH:ubiquinone oxidoreductase subunit K
MAGFRCLVGKLMLGGGKITK